MNWFEASADSFNMFERVDEWKDSTWPLTGARLNHKGKPLCSCQPGASGASRGLRPQVSCLLYLVNPDCSLNSVSFSSEDNTTVLLNSSGYDHIYLSSYWIFFTVRFQFKAWNFQILKAEIWFKDFPGPTDLQRSGMINSRTEGFKYSLTNHLTGLMWCHFYLSFTQCRAGPRTLRQAVWRNLVKLGRRSVTSSCRGWREASRNRNTWVSRTAWSWLLHCSSATPRSRPGTRTGGNMS